MSIIPESDDTLLGFIEDRKPSTFDTALNLFAEIAEKNRDALTAIAQKHTWLDAGPEEIVSDTIYKAFLTIQLQLGASPECLPEDAPVDPNRLFKFERQHGISMKAWLIQIMKGSNGGVLRNHNRRAETRSKNLTSVPDYESGELADTNHDAIEDTIDAIRVGDHIDQLEAAVEELPPRQRFIVTVRFGLGTDAPYSAPKLKSMVRDFKLPFATKIISLINRFYFSESGKKLQVQEIAVILDIGPKQVRREILAAYESIEAAFQTLEAA